MKNLLITALLFTSMQIVFGQSDVIKTAEIKTEISCNHCMQCGSCGQNIYTHVKENVKGVKNIKINPETNIISVKYNSEKTNLEAIEKAITLAGYKANDQEPTLEAYTNLDACCKRK